MNNKAQAKLALEYKSATRRRQCQILKELWETNKGIIGKISYPIYENDREDMIACLKTRFVSAINTFNPKKGDFFYYLRYQLLGERSKFIHKNHLVKYGETLSSLNKPTGSDNNFEFIDTIESTYETNYEHNPLKIFSHILNTDEIDVLKKYMVGMSYCKCNKRGHLSAVERIYGITRQTFTNKLNTVLNKLRRFVKENEIQYAG